MAVSQKTRNVCSGLLAVYFVGYGLFLAGFASDHWTVSGSSNTGLWRTCYRKSSDSTFTCDRLEVGNYPAWMKTVVAFMSLGLIFGFISGVTYMIVPFSAACQIFTGACAAIAVSTFAGYSIRNDLLSTSELGWSYWVIVIGGACFLANGIGLMVTISEEGFPMEKILPREKQTKIGNDNRFPTHIY